MNQFWVFLSRELKLQNESIYNDVNIEGLF